jgi:uncharacterized repeat protein (TIGR02543 family)
MHEGKTFNEENMKREILTKGMIRRAACALAAVWMACATAWAGEPVTYIDENGKEQTVTEYTVLTGDEPVTVDEYYGNYVSLAEGTYVVNSDVTYPCIVEMMGNVTLILADGANMTIQPTQGEYAYGIEGSNGLTIYGQENNTGTLTVSSYIKEEDVDAIFVSNLTVNGGVITTNGGIRRTFTLNRGSVTVNKGTNGKAYVDSGSKNNVTINGGTLTINGGDAPDTDNKLSGKNVTINGGTVTVTGDQYGIYAEEDVTITSGIVNATATATTGTSEGICCKTFLMSSGTVYATGQKRGIYAKSSFEFSGGQLTANVAEGSEWANSYGILFTGRKTIYYSHASDFIKASSYYGGSSFLFDSDANNLVGYVWVNELGTELSGLQETSADINNILAAINGQKLTPKLCTVTLPDGVTASGADVTVDGGTVKAVVALPVTLTTPGYENVSLTVKDANNQEVTLTDGTFTMPNSDVTVTGTMTPIVYHITYDLSGGTVATANPTTYTVESATFTLNNPSITGIDFLGWTGTDLDDLTMTVTIAKGSIGDRTYKANFDAVILQDGTAYTLTNDAEVKAATYTKTLGSARTGKFQAWLVPFDHAITEADAAKFTFYKINMIANAPNPETEASDEMWVFLKKMSLDDVLLANMPYVFKPKEDLESYAFTTPNATLKAKNTGVLATMQTMEDTYTLYATYEGTTATSVDPFYYVNIDGELSLGNDGTVTVGAYRWIMRVESKSGSTPAYARKMHFYDGGSTPTGISPAEIADCNATLSKREMAEMAGAWYTLDGRKLDTKPTTKGVYVVNGKKFVIK